MGNEVIHNSSAPIETLRFTLKVFLIRGLSTVCRDSMLFFFFEKGKAG